MAETEAVHRRLTARQLDVLGAVSDFWDENGYAPSARELTTVLGLASVSTAHSHLTNLRRDGYVTWVDGNARTLRLTYKGKEKLAPGVL